MSPTITIDPTATIGRINPNLFGYFVEHLGRSVYGGIYEPGSPHADADGFRLDVLEAVRALAPTTVRYPGGNFVSGYHWRDGVGPREQRPVRFEHAWKAVETNAFGTHEFITWAGASTPIRINLRDRHQSTKREGVGRVVAAGRQRGETWVVRRFRDGGRGAQDRAGVGRYSDVSGAD